jgi:hypothetical protein
VESKNDVVLVFIGGVVQHGVARVIGNGRVNASGKEKLNLVQLTCL